MKRYPAYKSSGVEWIGQVPKDWKVGRMKTVCTFTYGDSLASEGRIEGGVPVYGSNGIVGYHDKAITHRPCIIIGRKGSFGKVNYSEIECFPIDTTYFVDDRSTKCDLKWLNYLLPLLELDKFSNDTGVPGLNREEAHDRRIPIPDQALQRALASYLDSKTTQIDGLIAKKERMIELLKEERAAVINQAVTKGLNPKAEMKDSGIEWLGKVPRQWDIKKLKFLARIVTGGTPPKKEESNYSTEGTLWIKPDNLTEFIAITDSDEKLSPTGLVKSSLIPKDSVLVCCIGSIGKFGLCRDTCTTNQQINALVFNPSLFWRFGLYVISQLEQEQIRFANKNVVAILNASSQGEIVFPVPPENEQKSISDYLDSKTEQIDDQITRAQKAIELLKEYRTSLISEVVTGKIDVRIN